MKLPRRSRLISAIRSIISFTTSAIGMADPIDAIAGNVPPGPEGVRRCEFCQCALSRRGEVLEMSTRARELRNLADDLAREQAAHTTTKTELQTLRDRIAELERQISEAGAAQPTVRPGRFGTFK